MLVINFVDAFGQQNTLNLDYSSRISQVKSELISAYGYPNNSNLKLYLRSFELPNSAQINDFRILPGDFVAVRISDGKTNQTSLKSPSPVVPREREEIVDGLVSMGFTRNSSRDALEINDWNFDRAVDYLIREGEKDVVQVPGPKPPARPEPANPRDVVERLVRETGFAYEIVTDICSTFGCDYEKSYAALMGMKMNV